MQPHNRAAQLVLMALLALTLGACGSSASSTPPTSAPPQAAAPTSAPEPTTAPTTAAQPAGGTTGDLTDEELVKGLDTTFATFPRRQRTTVTLKSSNTTSTAVAELESADRIHASIEMKGQVYEAVVISPTVYIKTPQGWLQQKDPSSLQLFSVIANPSVFLKSSGFQDLLAELKKNKTPYKLIGTEQMGGVETKIYQYEVHSPEINATYTFWLGPDGRYYKLDSESERIKSSTELEFDPSIKVAAPAT